MIGTLRAPAQDAVRRAFEIAILRGAKEQAVCGGKMRRWQGASPAESGRLPPGEAALRFAAAPRSVHRPLHVPAR